MAAAKRRIRASKKFITQLREREANLTDLLNNPEYAHLIAEHGAEWERSLDDVQFQLDCAALGMPENEILEDLAIRHLSRDGLTP